MDSIVLPTNFDASNITYSEPRILDNGGKVIYMNYNRKKFIMQTPEMDIPFGVNRWNNEGKALDKYSLEMSFKDKDSRPVLKAFFDGMQAIDKKLMTDGFKNCQSWFKSSIKSMDVVEELYTQLVKYPKDGKGAVVSKYPPTFKVSVPHNGESFQCDAYDNHKNLVNLADIETKGGRASAIIQCVGIWVAGKKFGCSWKLLQMKITPPVTKIKGYAFKNLEEPTGKDIDEASDDDEDEVPDESLVQACVDGVKNDCDNEDDSDGDDSDDNVIESDDELDVKINEPTKKAPVKKKTTKQ